MQHLHALFQTGKIRAKQNDRAHAGYLAILCMKIMHAGNATIYA